MAGIGFVLEKILQKGTFGSLLQVSLSGVVVVAGPWLTSIFAAFLIGQFGFYQSSEWVPLFQSILVYSYSILLAVSGGFHYVFTRRISDQLFFHNNKQVAAILWSTLIVFAISYFLAGLGMGLWICLTRGLGWDLAVLVGLFWLVVGSNWFLLVFSSIFNRYQLLLLIYAGGTLGSVVGLALMAPSGGISGAVAGFSIGQLLIAIALAWWSWILYPPQRVRIADSWKGSGGYRPLFVGGLLHTLVLWVDKFVFWILVASIGHQPGQARNVEGTTEQVYASLPVFSAYDSANMIAQLSLLPTLVYFTVINETAFYRRLKVLLKGISTNSWQEISRQKRNLFTVTRDHLLRQTSIQAVFSLALIALVPWLSQIASGSNAAEPHLYFSLISTWLYGVYLTIFIYLLYANDFRGAYISAGLNVALTLVGSVVGWFFFADAPGILLPLAPIVASWMGWKRLGQSIQNIDRLLLTK